METALTPLASLSGGALIGVAAVLLMFLHGRIAGATGILAGILMPANHADWSWRTAMLVGMVTAPGLILALTGQMPTVDVPVSTVALLLGGLIVGVGVTVGSGCTSGHGVCGMARLSTRSVAATFTFMTATIMTVYVVRHVLGG